MFGILVSAFNTILGWVFRSVIINFVVFFALFAVTSVAVPWMLDHLLTAFDGAEGGGLITPALANLSSGVWYFLDLFQFPFALSVMLPAIATRFIIRRIPLIG